MFSTFKTKNILLLQTMPHNSHANLEFLRHSEGFCMPDNLNWTGFYSWFWATKNLRNSRTHLCVKNRAVSWIRPLYTFSRKFSHFDSLRQGLKTTLLQQYGCIPPLRSAVGSCRWEYLVSLRSSCGSSGRFNRLFQKHGNKSRARGISHRNAIPNSCEKMS